MYLQSNLNYTILFQLLCQLSQGKDLFLWGEFGRDGFFEILRYYSMKQTNILKFIIKIVYMMKFE